MSQCDLSVSWSGTSFNNGGADVYMIPDIKIEKAGFFSKVMNLAAPVEHHVINYITI